MSFSLEVKKELIDSPIKQTCCKKALLFGLLYNSRHIKGTSFSCEFLLEEAAVLALRLLGNQGQGDISSAVRGSRRIFKFEYSSKAFASFIGRVSQGDSISDAAKFRCAECAICFLRGVLISTSTINDPTKGYHLEIPLLPENGDRIESLKLIFAELDMMPNTLKREKKISLYFKSNTAICDILTYTGAKSAGFLATNTYIERDIRNNENRATNFVAKNISKSVAAAQKQIVAINKLKDADKLALLPPELLETAMLRLEHDDVTLSELALMHEPPISKSGLNHRLEKICRFSDDI